MFEGFIKDARHLERYRIGPFADERRRFLDHLAESGYSHGRLEVINRLLLAVAMSVGIDRDEKYSPSELATVANRWIREQPDRGALEKSLRMYELDFLFVARRWLEFLDRLSVPVLPQPFSQELDLFLQHLHSERGFANATIDNRRRSLRAFFLWLAKEQVTLLQHVDLDTISHYQAAGKSRGWKRTTISFHTQSLRTFFRYANSKGWSSIAVSAITTPRLYAYEGLPEGPKWPDVKTLLENEHGDSPVRIRNRAMFLLFARYGFRLSEVRLLELDDLDWEKERIVLRRSKLRRAHEYPLDREVGIAILRYLREVRPRSNHRCVFLSLRQPYRPLRTCFEIQFTDFAILRDIRLIIAM